ncbi:MAG: hypothetical protein PF447_07920 [Spirochaetaceae bacterium]|jgi:hypothetical protein|nr:hypothetical protein [Spirochaetaceae bacterium]
MQQTGAFYRGAKARILHYLYLVPMMIGFRPLILRFELLVFILYSLGFLFLLFLIIYSNNRSYIRYDERAMFIHLEYREGREEHRFDEILGYYRKRKGLFKLFSLEHKPLVITLGKKDGNRFAKLLDEKNIAKVERDIAKGKA